MNLTWREDSGSVQRVAELSLLGFDEALKRAMNDSDSQVRERAKNAMALFRAEGSGIPSSSNTSTTAENMSSSSFGSMIEHLGVDAVGRW